MTSSNSSNVSDANMQLITFKDDVQDNNCYVISKKLVKIVGSEGKHNHGSSQVKLKNVVDYKWDIKNHPGHLIAVHIDGNHIAYAIKVNNKSGAMEGMVRVFNVDLNLRTLIKGMTGEILDLQFAYIEYEHILASIDAYSLFVHKINMMNGNLVCNLIVKIEDAIQGYTPKFDKITWCPFLDTSSEIDDSKLIVWTRGNRFQCFNIKTIVDDNGPGNIKVSNLKAGYLTLQNYSSNITWTQISPDASTLGVGSVDGLIRFYQIYMHDDEPRCLHNWTPHKDQAISSFFFLDDLTNRTADSYWKYALTAAAQNTELKLWDCSTWNCLQTIWLTSKIPREERKSGLHFLAEMSRSASYLVLTCFESRTAYVMQINNNNNNNDSNSNTSTTSGDDDDDDKDDDNENESNTTNDSLSLIKARKKVHIRSVAEFPMNSVVLSFSIVDAAIRRYKCREDDNYLCEEMDDFDEETNSVICVVVRMFIVQPKSLQECRILYQPGVFENDDIKSTISDGDPAQFNHSKESTNVEDFVAIKKEQINGETEAADDEAENGEAVVNANDVVVVVLEDGEVKPKKIAADADSNDDDDEEDDDDDDEEDDDENDSNPLLTDENDDVDAAEVDDENADNENEKLTAGEKLLAAATTAADDTKQKSQNVLEAFLSSAAAASSASGSPNASVVIEEEVEAAVVTSPNGSAGKQLPNLMTPDAFTCTDKAPEGVSSEVLNTILMLAGVPGQKGNNMAAAAAAAGKSVNVVNNKVLEEQAQQKQKQAMEAQKKFMENAGEKVAVDAGGLASGASSPSREVREIMSSHDYDKSSYSGDELLDETQINDDDDDDDAIDAATTNITKINKSQKSTSSQHPSKHSTELQNAANLISQAVHASSSSNLNCMPPTFGNATSSSSASTTIGASGGGGGSGTISCSSAEISAMNLKMNHLIDLIKVQSMQINSLQNEIADIKKCNPLASAKNMSEFSYKLEIQLSKLLENYLKRLENEHNKKITAFMAGRDIQNREMRESYMQILNQYLLSQVGDIVSKVITIEIQRQIAPMLSAKMDQLHKQIHVDVAQKLTSFDKMLHENISQVCKSKNIIETFGKSVLLGVQNSLQAAFMESMSTTLIPAYEKSSQNMFKQLHDAFSDGIREFMLQLDKYMRNLHPVQASNDDMREKFVALKQHLDSMLNKHRNVVNETMLETRKDVKGLEILLGRQIENTLRTEMRKCFDNHQTALRSQANTPAPAMYDKRESIKAFLQQGQINNAFHLALLANDLSLVEFTLKHIDHNVVFNPQCCLEQKVLLSLIQQISADMTNHNEIKQNYLSESLCAIEPNDPITREHAPKVLQELLRSCQNFLINQPKSPQCSNVRMLMKAIQGFKDQF